MAEATLKLALIGAGRIGRLHATHIVHRLSAARLVVIADSDADAARRCAAELGVAEAVGDYRLVLDRSDVDAVVICAPTSLHARMIEESVDAGKHVFCEKPIAYDLSRVDHVLGAVESSGLKLQVGFNRRFDANFRRVRAAIEQGEIGEPHLLHIVSRDPVPPDIEYMQASGGIFFDMTIHDFDMARFLIADEVDEVYAAAGVRVDPAIGEAGDLDTALITLKFANGVMGTIDNSRRAVYGYDQRVEVFGSGGSVQTQNRFPNAVTIWGADSIRRDLPLNFFLDRYAESFLNEMQEFVDAVLQDRPVPVGGHDARAPVVLAMAARRSHEENRPVRLAEIENGEAAPVSVARGRGTGPDGRP